MKPVDDNVSSLNTRTTNHTAVKQQGGILLFSDMNEWERWAPTASHPIFHSFFCYSSCSCNRWRPASSMVSLQKPFWKKFPFSLFYDLIWYNEGQRRREGDRPLETSVSSIFSCFSFLCKSPVVTDQRRITSLCLNVHLSLLNSHIFLSPMTTFSQFYLFSCLWKCATVQDKTSFCCWQGLNHLFSSLYTCAAQLYSSHWRGSRAFWRKSLKTRF